MASPFPDFASDMFDLSLLWGLADECGDRWLPPDMAKTFKDYETKKLCDRTAEP
jgi:hypothetical protein